MHATRRSVAASVRTLHGNVGTLELLHSPPNATTEWDTIAAFSNTEADETDKEEDERDREATAVDRTLEEQAVEMDIRGEEERNAVIAMIEANNKLKTDRLEDLEKRAKQQRESLAESIPGYPSGASTHTGRNDRSNRNHCYYREFTKPRW